MFQDQNLELIYLKLNNHMSNFHSLEAAARCSKTQLQVGENENLAGIMGIAIKYWILKSKNHLLNNKNSTHCSRKIAQYKKQMFQITVHYHMGCSL